MMDVYDPLIYDFQRYIQWPKINFIDEHPISCSFFQELKEKYEMTKVEIQVKKLIYKDGIQEFLVKPLKEFSEYTTFVQKHMLDMEIFKEFNITLNIKKEHIFNSQEKRILTQHDA